MTKAKIVSAALSATTALLSIAPTTFATTVSVSGNGAASENTVNLAVSKTVSILQQNSADVDNNVGASANTGGNSANDNTGGDVSIDTGNATTKLLLSTTANSNKSVGACCTGDLSVDAKISGNGSDSENEINLRLNNEFNSEENNNLDIDNRIDLSANTGDNRANGNTGGATNISTGNALIELVLTNKGNSNSAEVGCCEPGEEELPPLPGTVSVIPAAAAPVGKTLPVTGFDYQLLLVGSALVSSAGLVLRKGGQKLEGLFGKA